MLDWYQRAIKPTLQSAVNNDQLTIDAVHEFLVWRQGSQGLGFDTNELKNEDNEGLLLSANAIRNAANKASQKCLRDKDPSMAGVLIKFYALTELLPINGLSGLNSQDIKEMALKCAKFEIKFTSRMLHRNTTGGSSEFQASGSIPLVIDQNFTLSGEGEIKTNSYIFEGVSCTQSRPEIYHVKIQQAGFSAGNKPQVTLFIDLGEELPDITATCPEEYGSIHMDGTIWDGDFVEMHLDDHITGNIFKLTNWDILGKGGTYAKKVYQKTKNLGVPVTEDTTLELIHRPVN